MSLHNDVPLQLIADVKLIDVVILGVTIWQLRDPDVENMVGLVLNSDRPKPHEVKAMFITRSKKEFRCRLYIVKDPCPIRWSGVCPMCEEVH